MNKETFLKELALGLTSLSEEERRRILEYYGELICDGIESGKSEEAVIQDFGPPKEIAAQICAEARQDAPQPTAAGQKIYTPKGLISAVLVQAENLHITVQEAVDGPLQVLFTPLECDELTITEENGVFRFLQTIKPRLFHWRDLLHGPRSILVRVPAGFTGLTIHTSNGKIEAEGLRDIRSASFTSSNASISVCRTHCTALQVCTSNGRIHLQDNCGSTCSAKSSNAPIKAESCRFPTHLSLRTCNGAVRANQIVSDDIALKSSNGALQAVICGDLREYEIHSHTNNASSTLPSDWACAGQTKHLSAVTNNAQINIQFAASVN
ncbi:MAG: DUF1700 domain-containing protein [Oscillospiraceae bacterium]|nr:DUF1700 domain-containing protein [Oscillospiraceae bacterium]